MSSLTPKVINKRIQQGMVEFEELRIKRAQLAEQQRQLLEKTDKEINLAWAKLSTLLAMAMADDPNVN